MNVKAFIDVEWKWKFFPFLPEVANPVSKVLSHELSWRANPHKLGPRDHKTIAAAIYSNMRAFNCRPCDCYHIFRRPGFKTSNAGNRTFLCFNEKFRKKCDLVARQLHTHQHHHHYWFSIHNDSYPCSTLSSEYHHHCRFIIFNILDVYYHQNVITSVLVHH